MKDPNLFMSLHVVRRYMGLGRKHQEKKERDLVNEGREILGIWQTTLPIKGT